jgi:hypothetical protein
LQISAIYRPLPDVAIRLYFSALTLKTISPEGRAAGSFAVYSRLIMSKIPQSFPAA